MARKSSLKQVFRPSPLSLAIAACFASTLAFALPTGGQVTSGSATFSQTGNTLTITNTSGSIINWQSFSIGSGEVTRFIQPSTSSSVLNRVITNDPSIILGQLQSNGQVFLINPAGILVGSGARIDVGNFVASSLQMSDADFLAKRFVFQNTPGAGLVRNEGTITTPTGGSVYLIAPQVENAGIIHTPQGETLLAAGQTVEIGDTATPGVRVAVTGSDTQATNIGSIVADSGRIGMVGALVKNRGALSASSAVSEGGRIFLRATSSIEQSASGRIEANGAAGGQVSLQSGDTTVVEGQIDAVGLKGKGGTVEVLGEKVGLFGNAHIDASGTTGGGTILVGGDYQGNNPNVQNAQTTFMSAQAQIKADATQNGDGGKIIVWANDTTRAYGTISARGGSQGGDGGFVETSGKKFLDVGAIEVDRGASAGKAGTWLLDPSDVTLTFLTDSFSGGGYNDYPPGKAFENAGNGAILNWGTIRTNLDAGPVIISTVGSGGSGNISFDTAYVDYTLNKNNDLWLVANGNINIQNVNVQNSGTGDFKFIAGWTGSTLPGTPWDFNAYSVVGGTGSLLVQNARVDTNGSVYVKTASGVTVEKTTTAAQPTHLIGSNVSIETYGNLDVLNHPNLAVANSFETAIAASGNLDIQMKGASTQINIEASGANGGGAASIRSGGDMSIVFSGGGANLLQMTGGNVNSPVNSSAMIQAQGDQTITHSAGTLNISLTGGNASVTGKDVWEGAIPICSGCATGNGAEIRASGTQTITASTISLQGGSGGNGNFAEISSVGTQVINTSGALTLSAGNAGGGVFVPGYGTWGLIGNDAGIHSEFSQTLNIGGNLTMTGGTAVSGVAGAYITAPDQTLYVGGNLSMVGGNSNTPALPGLGMGSGAVIGFDHPAITYMVVNGNLSMTAGNGSEGAAYIGTLGDRATVNITANSISMNGTAASRAGIGSMDGLTNNGLINLRATGGSINLGAYSHLLAGFGGSTTLIANNAGAGDSIYQSATDTRISATYLTASGDKGILFNGPDNQSEWVSLQSSGGVVHYVSNAPFVHVDKALSGTDNVTLLTSNTGGDQSIGLGTIQGGMVTVNARNAIFDDNGDGVVNITGSSIILSTTQDGNPGGIAISADISTSGGISATVPAASGPGGIRIHSVGVSAPSTVNLNDATVLGTGDIFFLHDGSLTTTNGNFVINSTSGSAIIGTGGDLNYNGGVISAPKGVAIKAGNDLNLNTNLTSSGNFLLSAGNAITFNSTVSNAVSGDLFADAASIHVNSGGHLQSRNIVLSAGALTVDGQVNADGNIGVSAGQVVINGGTLNASSGDFVADVAGDIKMTGGTIAAGNNVWLSFDGANSTLYLNELPSQPTARIISGSAGTIEIDFWGRSQGGIVIDGVPGQTTVLGGSGFYNADIPAALGSGLIVTYGGNLLDGTFLSDILGATSALDSSYTGVPFDTASTSQLPTDPFAGVVSGASGMGEAVETFSSLASDEFGQRVTAGSGTNQNGSNDGNRNRQNRRNRSVCR